jgi:magnesium-protoporphyrin IX monomethyl ester (oxidative) cyclase
MNTLAPEFKDAHPINLSTDKALENTMLSPRFYTTDFEELDGMNI